MPDPAQHRIPSPTRRWTRPAGAAAAAALAAVVLAGCGGGDDGSQASAGGTSTPRVAAVATTSQLGDIVRAVGGDAVDVHQILQPNTDPHEYEPRPVDVTETAKAKVVFASGLGLDGWVDDVEQQSGGDAAIVRVGDAVPTKLAGEEEGGGHEHAEGGEHGDHDHEHEGEYDPHWWHDPTNVEQAVGTIRDAIAKADPQAAPAVRRSAAAYLTRLQALDGAIETCIAQVPRADRKLVTSHDAFNYFAHRYGITVIGAAIPSQTTRAQPSAGEVSDLVKVIERERVKAIFPESSVNPKLAQAIAKETGATSSLTLYGDTLGAAGSDGATYLGMERHNADSVVRGFTGGAEGCAAGS